MSDEDLRNLRKIACLLDTGNDIYSECTSNKSKTRFVLFIDKAASAKGESSAKGARNERFSMSKICQRQTKHFDS